MRRSMLTILALGLAIGSAWAQSEAPAAEDCMARPQDESQVPGPNEQRTDQPRDETLTGKLDPCNGVLKPPPVGDSEISETPPDTGKTPVIRPDEVEPQPPQQN